MSLKTDLEAEVAKILKDTWTERDGQVVPSDDTVRLGNDAVKLEATILYADLADSTKLVDGKQPWFAAEIYKTFLHCAAKIIKTEGGIITAYDGDRIMAVYMGGFKNTSAVKTALKINYATTAIIQPLLDKRYPEAKYNLKHVVGIDTSKLFVARTGVRGANDLVWVGRAANYAAKLAALPETYQSYITKEVYDVLHESGKTSSDGRSMWQAASWTTFDNRTIYRSNWRWKVN